MSLQTTAAKLLFKLPAPLLNKVMKFLTPAKKQSKMDLQKNLGT